MTNQFTILRNQFEHSRIESIVAMSVYSGDNAKWLKEAIDSIIHQTYTQFLFVIVMDIIIYALPRFVKSSRCFTVARISRFGFLDLC